MKVLLGQTPQQFEINLVQRLSCETVGRDLGIFPNGEFSLSLSCPREPILVIPSYSPKIHDYLMEAQVLCYAAKQTSQNPVYLLLPYLPYSRQDQGLHLGHLVIRQCLTAGVDRLLTIDIHNPKLITPFPACTDISIQPVFIQDIQERFDLTQVTMVAPDEGSYAKVHSLAHKLDISCIHLIKTRHHGQVSFASFEANLTNRIVLLMDDMIDTASTMVQATHILKFNGAREIHGYGTHGILSPPAKTLLQNAPLDSLTVTNTIPLKEVFSPLRIIDASWIAEESLKNLETSSFDC